MNQVDVVLVAFESARDLASSLPAVVADPAVASVTVVDNASKDDSASVASRLGAAVVRLDANIGFGAGCNRGAALGHAPYILFLNPDAVVAPGTVATLRDHLDAHPAVAIAGPPLVYADGTPQPVRRRFPSVLRAPLEPGLAAALDERYYARRPGRRVAWLSGACLLVRRAAFEEAKGFDERYFLYAEELDLASRLTAAGWALHRVDAPAVVHASGSSTRHLPAAGKVAWADGMSRWATDHHRLPVAFRCACAFGLAARAAWWSLRGKRIRAGDWWRATTRMVCHAGR